MNDNDVPAWYDADLPPPKVGRVLFGLERQRAIDEFMISFVAERVGEQELTGLLVEYVNSYRRCRGHGRRTRTSYPDQKGKAR